MTGAQQEGREPAMERLVNRHLLMSPVLNPLARSPSVTKNRKQHLKSFMTEPCQRRILQELAVLLVCNVPYHLPFSFYPGCFSSMALKVRLNLERIQDIQRADLSIATRTLHGQEQITGPSDVSKDCLIPVTKSALGLHLRRQDGT